MFDQTSGTIVIRQVSCKHVVFLIIKTIFSLVGNEQLEDVTQRHKKLHFDLQTLTVYLGVEYHGCLITW